MGRIGQLVELPVDVYGSGVVFHGKVIGFSTGTGAAFSLLLAQTATGNGIKVVQRLPVRIEGSICKSLRNIRAYRLVDDRRHRYQGRAGRPTWLAAKYGDQENAEIARIIAACSGPDDTLEQVAGRDPKASSTRM